MTEEQPQDIAGTLARYLETDMLLGAKEAPLSLVRPGRPSASPPQRSVSGPAVRPAAVPPTANRGKVIKVQELAPAEIEERAAQLKALDDDQVKTCTKCGLCETRTKTVFGQGHPAARLVFVGEAPGRDEDQQGLAFVGRAGQLLTKMIAAMGLSRDEVFICNILKCRPPDNRDPAPDEISACWPYLNRQLQIIRPEVIVALGKPSAQTLLQTSEGIGRLRGVWHDYYVSGSPDEGPPTPLMPTYHPAYLLRSPGEKAKAWSDLKEVMARLDLPLTQ